LTEQGRRPGLGRSALSALDRHPYINLATFRRSGAAVETPVWFAARDGKLYVFTAAGSGKVKRLRRDSRVRVAPCTLRGRPTGAWIEGRGRRVEDAELEAAAYAALRAKYGWQMRLTDLLSRLSGRIQQRAVLELEVRSF
jgi:PPOX class probable F420-dependent enzyme